MNELTQTEQPSANGHEAVVDLTKPTAAALSNEAVTADPQAVAQRMCAKAHIIRDIAFPAAMATAIPVAQDIGTAAFKLYLDGLRRDAGNPTDPVEAMLLEQLSLAHHRVAQLHAQAERSKSLEEIKIYTMAAARLTGEFRRLALGLNQYRQPAPRRSFTLIRQQNLSQAGQQVAYFDRGNESRPQIPCNGDGGELPSSGPPRIGIGVDRPSAIPLETPRSMPAEYPTETARQPYR